MTRFLFEIGSEEIPARMQAAAAAQLAKRFAQACAAAGLTHGTVTADATPRRLWLVAEDMAAASAATTEELKGPRADAPPQAIEGFLKKTGLTQEQLEPRDTGKGIVLFAVLKRDGRAASAILSDIIPQIITSFDWPKSMRWGAPSASTASPRWVRPLTHLVALLDEAVVPATVHGLTTGRTSRGHRVHAPGPLDITSASTYAAQLRAAHVIVDSAERRHIIAARAAELAAAANLSVIPDAGLEVENAGLTEWPVPLLGHFDPAFLSVPREVIQLTMRTNQKYFATRDNVGLLAPSFICVLNLEPSDGGSAAAVGNERVLSARLQDAKFFWENDKEFVQKSGLERFLPALEKVTFHSKLGNVSQKIERLQKVSIDIFGEILIGGLNIDLTAGAYFSSRSDADSKISEAARLAKADLVSATVSEFPETQGLIGSYLYNFSIFGEISLASNPFHGFQSGQSPIADAISEHYLPVNATDPVPNKIISITVGMADRIDILVGFFMVANELPTGSRDPFALRRQALTLIQLIVANNLRVRVSALISAASDAYHSQGHEIGDANELRAFFADRLKVQQREAGVRPDIIDAVFALGEDDIVRLLARVHALQAFLTTEDGANLLAGYKRAANILKAEDARDGPHAAAALDSASLTDPAEKALSAALGTALPTAAAAVEKEDFTGAMAALAELRAPVDRFFDQLMVNAPEPAVRKNRLALLAAFRDAVHTVADFSRIEG